MTNRPKLDEQFTLMLVPDGQSSVRRYRVHRSWLRRAIIAASVVGALILGVAMDWVRLRLDAVDVDEMRAETEQYRVEVETLRGGLARVDGELERLQEFERKVRIIANLPSTLAQAVPSAPRAEHAQGGPDNEPDADANVPGDLLEPPIQAEEPAPVTESDETAALADPDRPADLEEVQRLNSWAQKLVVALRTRHGSYAMLVDGLETQSVRLASTPSIWPAEGWVTSRYGRRISPFTGRPHFHAGLDIAADFGTPVVAPAAGRVHFAGRKGALGRAVVLEHGYGVRTTYGHLSGIDVKRGQRVERGEPVGTVGSTGRSTGPHLHYAVAVNGKNVNPLNYVLE